MRMCLSLAVAVVVAVALTHPVTALAVVVLAVYSAQPAFFCNLAL
jgi:hypothetical protein